MKTLTDRDVRSIDWTPRPTTIAALGRLRRVTVRPQDRRAGTHERRVYCIEGLLEIEGPRPQEDGDLHVVLADPDDPRRSLVVEIPDPKCRNVCGSPWVSVFANARAELEGRIRRETRDTIRVVVTGVGFFDRNHGQIGAAPNFFELHPVLSVRFPEPARPRRR